MLTLRSTVLAFTAPALAFALSGCEAHHQFATPNSPILGAAPMHPHEVRYELLAVGRGQACRGRDELKKLERLARLPGDEKPVGNRFVYEEAKYAAIEAVPGADNLLFVRARAEYKDDEICVTVTGRGYRITSLRSTSPLAEPDRPALPVAAPAVAR